METSKYRKIVERPGLDPKPRCMGKLRGLQRSPTPYRWRGASCPLVHPRYRPLGLRRQDSIDRLAVFGNSLTDFTAEQEEHLKPSLLRCLDQRVRVKPDARR